MSIHLTQGPMTYTVKYQENGGLVQLVDIQANGTGDAKDKFTRDYPQATLINIFRKS